MGDAGLIAAEVLKVDDAELVVLFGGLRCRVSTDTRRSAAIADDGQECRQENKRELRTWAEDLQPSGPVTVANLAGPAGSSLPSPVDVEAANTKAHRNPLLTRAV